MPYKIGQSLTRVYSLDHFILLSIYLELFVSLFIQRMGGWVFIFSWSPTLSSYKSAFQSFCMPIESYCKHYRIMPHHQSCQNLSHEIFSINNSHLKDTGKLFPLHLISIIIVELPFSRLVFALRCGWIVYINLAGTSIYLPVFLLLNRYYRRGQLCFLINKEPNTQIKHLNDI